jgi:hypothetical protein
LGAAFNVEAQRGTAQWTIRSSFDRLSPMPSQQTLPYIDIAGFSAASAIH